MLDAGTGAHSLGWLRTLGVPVTGVTADPSTADRLRGPGVELVLGDWQDGALLAGRRFDVVVADYLLGAIDGFAPYFQETLFSRLRPHVRDSLYVIGLEPWPPRADDPDAQAFVDLCRLRDAAFLVSGTRPYREVPQSVAARWLADSGYEVTTQRSFPIHHSWRTIDREHGNVVRAARNADPAIGAAMARRADELASRLRARPTPLVFGADYVIACVPSGSR